MKTNFYSKAHIAVVVFLSAVIFSCNNTKEVSSSDLEGYWVLKTFNGMDAKTLFEGALPTLQFDFDNMTLSGTGGCNRYTGAFTYEKNRLSAPDISATQMLCFEKNDEQRFFIELAKENILSVVNGILTVKNRDKIITMEFEKGEMPADASGSLKARDLNGTWNLRNMEGDGMEEIFGKEGIIPTMTFDSSNMRVSGNAGCNNYNTEFNLDGHSLSFGKILTTRMTCPGIDGENKLINILSEKLQVSMPSSGILMLVKDNKVVLEFEKIAE